MADGVEQASIRGEHFSEIVKGFGLQEFKLKQVVQTEASSDWTETFFAETATELTAAGNAGANIKGVPRLANFPHAGPTWTKNQAQHKKYAVEGTVSIEDVRSSQFNVIMRTLLRIGRAVANNVDLDIYASLSSGSGQTVAAGGNWDDAIVANRDPIQDILNAQKLITIQNYDIYTEGVLLINPTDFANMLGNANVRNAGQFYTDDVTRNGLVGMLLKLKVIVTNAVSADEAMVMKSGLQVWKSLIPLTTSSVETPGQYWLIKAWEIGHLQITEPNAICTITNTAA